jgi:competence protein ComEC
VTAALLAWAAGAALLQLQAELPGPAWAAGLPFAGWLAWRRPRLAFVLAFALGFAWAAAHAHWRMDEWLDPALEGRDIEVRGVVSSLPALGERSVRFELDVEAAAAPLPRKLLLSWYAPTREGAPAALPEVHPGERWSFVVRLRRPHGTLNPHGFDYEAWLLERGIGATGYVRPGAQAKLGERAHAGDRVERLREAVRDRFFAVLGHRPAAGILAALAVGDQRAIANEEWQLFNATGVTHLMSISGLHVTLISGLVAWVVAALWRRAPWLALRLAARRAGALAAIAAALAYTSLAGFAIPAQRTFYMVSVVALALWLGRIASPMRVLALALAAVVAADPWAPLAPGFWLSFGAVALIFYVGSGWSRPEPWWLQWPRLQWSITLGLAPAVLLLFGQVSLAGPLANAVAIPLVSAVITPIALAAAVLPIEALLHAGAWLVEGLLQFLEWCASLPGALWRPASPSPWALVMALAGVAWLLAPRGIPWRAAGLGLMAPAFAMAAPAPPAGAAWVTVLDVGQGLAVLVRTANRTLLYDAGPAYGVEADSGSRIVMPALRGAGVPGLDTLLLSHEDMDHIGGARTVMEGVAVSELVSSLPRSHPLQALAGRAQPCSAGRTWLWDGVRFEILHPRLEMAGRRNDRSCVVRIATASAAILIPGDIEAAGEAALLEEAARLRSDVLLVPHHGSRTSSAAAFVSAVAPQWAIVSVGRANRFGHPHPGIVARYRALGSRILRTDRHGAVHVRLQPEGLAVESERVRRARYWRRPAGV